MARDIYFYGRSSKGITDSRYQFCSNFHIAPFIIDSKDYMTVEHYYQSKKHEGTELEETIRLAPSPREAKELAWSEPILNVKMWDDRKDEVMLTGIRAKFSQNPELKKKIIR